MQQPETRVAIEKSKETLVLLQPNSPMYESRKMEKVSDCPGVVKNMDRAPIETTTHP
jgi:hypothetical protein